MRDDGHRNLTLPEKARLAIRIWRTFVFVRSRVHRQPLPELVNKLASVSRSRVPAYAPRRLSLAVDNALSIRNRRPTCLVSALVLFRLLAEQGEQPELVIGLPDTPVDHFAHAWVELAGQDVGPPPGRGRHSPLARFGSVAPA